MTTGTMFSVARFREYLRYRWLPTLVDLHCDLAVRKASKLLKAQGVERVLVDNTVLAGGVTHETARINTGTKMWGDTEIETYYTARIPVHSDEDDGRMATSVRYLAGIASLAKLNNLCLLTSDELEDEQWTHPVGRFRGRGICDFNLFRNVDFERIRDPEYFWLIGSKQLEVPCLRDQRAKRLALKSDPLYHELLPVLGKNHSQDIWHIVTAERNKCYCFLTMDFRLIRNVRAQSRNPVVASLSTKVLSPEEFGQEFRIPEISPRLFSYHDACGPVRADLNWPDSKRQKRRSH